MGILNNGVSGGVAVASQYTGVSLSLLGDYAYILPSNAAPTPGPDTAGYLTVSGAYGAGAVLAFEKCVSPQDWAAANWTPLFGVLYRTTGLPLPNAGNTSPMTVSQPMDFVLSSVQGFYALRARLATAPASGAPVLSGTTFPIVSGNVNPAVLAAYAGFQTYMAAMVLAQNDQSANVTDYLAAVGGSW